MKIKTACWVDAKYNVYYYDSIPPRPFYPSAKHVLWDENRGTQLPGKMCPLILYKSAKCMASKRYSLILSSWTSVVMELFCQGDKVPGLKNCISRDNSTIYHSAQPSLFLKLGCIPHSSWKQNRQYLYLH